MTKSKDRSPIGASPIGGASEALEEQEEMSPSVSQIAPASKRAELGSEPSAADQFLAFCARHLAPCRRDTLSDRELLSIIECHPALRDALPHPEPSAAWRPIETAPRDGTVVVLAEWSGDNRRWSFSTSYWRKYPGDYGEGFAWIGREPTHWMPLPGAPA